MYRATIYWADGTTETITGMDIAGVAQRIEEMKQRHAPVSYNIVEAQEGKENDVHPAEY